MGFTLQSNNVGLSAEVEKIISHSSGMTIADPNLSNPSHVLRGLSRQWCSH
jgi:hypothetical protein